MDNIIKFVRPGGGHDAGPDWTPDFILKARQTEAGYEVAIDELDEGPTKAADIFRRVAAQLLPIAGGLWSHAEDMSPSERGKIVAQVTVYEDGTSDMHLVPFEDTSQRAWVTAAFTKILAYIRAAPLKA